METSKNMHGECAMTNETVNARKVAKHVETKANDAIKRAKAILKNGRKEVTHEKKEAWVQLILSHFLLITFTDAAAQEMRGRVAGAFASSGITVDPEKIPVMTFNAFYMNVIKTYYAELGFKAVPSVIDTNPTSLLTKMIPLITGAKRIRGLNYSISISMEMGAAKGAAILSRMVFDIIRNNEIDIHAANALDTLRDKVQAAGIYKQMTDESLIDLMARYDEFCDILKNEGLITFADQEPMALKLLKAHPEFLKESGFWHIVVDEFQDSSNGNMEFVKLLLELANPISLMVIGDDNQSIYKFRDANVENMIDFEKKMGVPVKTLNMSQNYRSFSEIIELADKLVALNTVGIDKKQIAAKGPGGKVVVKGFESSDEMYTTIADIAEECHTNGRAYGDIAIICKQKDELGRISAIFDKKNIPWVIMAPMKLAENSRVRGAMKLCEAFFDPDATQCYFEYLVPLYDGKIYEELTPEELDAEIDALRRSISNFDSMSPENQLRKWHEYLEAINIGNDELYQKWLDMVYAEDTKIDPDDPNKSALAKEIEFIKNFKLYGKNTEAKMDQKYQGVVLVTAHSSKGLEWPVVINCLSKYDNRMLHKASNIMEVEEVRRLLFVSMTRAKEELYVFSEYVAYSDEFSGETYNQFLHDLYKVNGKEKEFEAEILAMKQRKAQRELERKAAQNARAKEKREAAKAKRMADAIMGDGTLTVPGLGMTKRDKYVPDVYSSSYKGGGKMTSKGSKSRTMTDAEKKQYDTMTKNAKQITVADILGDNK